MGQEDAAIVGLGTRADYVGATPGFDSGRSRLTPNESTLLSAVGRYARISEAIVRSGLPEPIAIAGLLSLRAKGAIRPARVEAPATPAHPSGLGDAALSEEVDVPEARKREILALEARLGTANFFELLGVGADSDRAAITRAYHEASLKFHPDRYFQRNVGSFRARLEKIFRRLSEAHQTLSDDAKRKVYLRAHPEAARTLAPSRPAAPATPNPSSRTPLPGVGANTPIPRQAVVEDPARVAERRSRLAHHPYLARVGKTKELLAAGRAHLHKGEFDQALQQLNLAAQLDPNLKEVQALLEEVRRLHSTQRSKDTVRRAELQARDGDFKAALSSYRSAFAIDSNNGEAATRAAALSLQVGESPNEAKILAQKGVELTPRRSEAHLVLGLCHLALDVKKLAKRNFEEALERDPENEEAKKQLKKFRWPF